MAVFSCVYLLLKYFLIVFSACDISFTKHPAEEKEEEIYTSV